MAIVVCSESTLSYNDLTKFQGTNRRLCSILRFGGDLVHALCREPSHRAR
jgi:hypothetical protein